MTTGSTRPRWQSLALLVVLAGAMSCVDGLRPRTAPYDVDHITIDLVPIRDTVRVPGDLALYYIRSNRIHHDYPVVWERSHASLIGIHGGGIFGLAALPADTTRAWVYARIGTVRDSAALVIIP